MRPRPPMLALGLMALVSGCAEPDAVVEERPDYTRPAWATDGRSDVETSLRLTDVTAAAGIDFVHATGAFGEKWMPETMGSGVAVFDYDDDGWPDLFFVNSTGWPGRSEDRGARSGLYRNRG